VINYVSFWICPFFLICLWNGFSSLIYLCVYPSVGLFSLYPLKFFSFCSCFSLLFDYSSIDSSICLNEFCFSFSSYHYPSSNHPISYLMISFQTILLWPAYLITFYCSDLMFWWCHHHVNYELFYREPSLMHYG